MFTDFNRIYSLEIDLKNLEVVYNSKALYSNIDLNTSTMMIKLTIDQKALDITDKTITAYIKTQKDNVITMQRCEILESSEGIIGLDFNSSALKAGTNTFFLEIRSDNDEIINSPLITYKVVELLDVSDSVEGDNNVSILVQLISEVNVVKESVETLRDEITANETIRESNETARVESERVRVEEENNRIAAETNRVTSENDRSESEITRIDNEHYRVENEKSRVSAESGRVSSESERVLAETKRAEDFENMKNEIKDHISNHPQGVTIDDDAISKEKTWSSVKIEDFVHTNNDVVWGTAKGENLSIDFTKEGYLREIEIFGNTIQGFADCVTNKQIVDSILSTGLDNNARLNNDNTLTVSKWGFDSTTDWNAVDKEGFIQLDPNTKYSVGCWRDNGTFPNVTYILYEETGIKSFSGYATPTFTTGASGKVLLYPTTSQSGKLNIRVVKGDYKLTDYPYDYNLSTIKHLGELYVDEEGQPILDNEGREQYKIEIKSCNKNLFCDEIMNGKQIKKIVDGESGYYIDKAIESVDIDNVFVIDKGFKERTSYVFTCTTTSDNWIDINIMYTDGTISMQGVMKQTNSILSNGDKTIKFITFTTGGENFIKNIQLEEGEVNTDIIPNQSSKTTLLLPSQLSKIGDVIDRLFWDNEKKKYVVEKKFENAKLKDVYKTILDTPYGAEGENNDGEYMSFKIFPKDGVFPNIDDYYGGGGIKLCSHFPIISPNKDFEYIHRQWGTLFVRIAKSKLNGEANINTFTSFLIDKEVYVEYQLKTPQLIETNITEPISIPCYKDKTHIFITGGIDGSIKAKAPLDGGQAIQSLSAENKVLKTSNIELKQTNEIQDVLIDTTMMATDEMFMLFEPLLSQVVETLQLTKEVSKMVDMYVAMVMRGLKTIDEVPARYREQVKEILAQLEK